jgi:hypothetical protein
MAKAVLQIASMLNVPVAEAHHFCAQVQRRLGQAPAYVMIAQCLQMHPDMPRTPDAVAAKLIESGWSPRGRSSKVQGRTSKTRQRRRIREPSLKLEPIKARKDYGLKPCSVLDKSRVAADRLRKCPHGIPVTEPCGICNREEFARLTGIE